MIRVDVANCKGDPRRNQQGIESEIIERLSLSLIKEKTSDVFDLNRRIKGK